MSLFAILHADAEGLHPHSCCIVEAESETEISTHILTHSQLWYPVLAQAYTPEERQPLWERLQQGALLTETLIEQINRTDSYQDSAEQVRIVPIEVQTLPNLRLRTRWSMLGSWIIESIPKMTPSTLPTSLDALLAEIVESRWRNRQMLKAQLHEIHHNFAEQMQHLHYQEQVLMAAHTTQLAQIRSHLAADARSLFKTVMFQQFVEEVLTLHPTAPWGLSDNFEQWVLGNQPVQIEAIQSMTSAISSASVEVQMQVRLGDWVQSVQVSFAIPPDAVDRTVQWQKVLEQFEPTLADMTIAAELQALVVQELTAIVVFVAQTFFLPRLIDRVPDPEMA